MTKKTLLAVAVLAVALAPPNTHAQFTSLETDNLRLIYMDAMQSSLAPYVAQCFENSLRFHEAFWDYESQEKITVSLFDISDFGNAGAGVAPENKIVILIEPSSYAYETMPANERMNATMNHELVHVVAFDKAAGLDPFFRHVFFGKVSPTSDNPLSVLYSYMTTPRVAAPRWFHEGIAVFMETWMAGGLGRALGAYDEMVFRTMVLEDSHFYDPVGLESEGTRVDFQLGVNSYLYGTRFMSYLALQHGTEKLIDWVSRSKGSRRNYVSQFKHVYGTPLGAEWSRWIDWEHEFQRQNIDSIRTYPVTGYRDLSTYALGSVSRAYYDTTTNELYAGVNYPGKVPHIAAINVETGESRKVCEVKGAALYFVSSLAFDPDTRTLFYTTDNNAMRDLKAVDMATGDSRMLLKDIRTGDLAFNAADRSIWGVRHYNGISTLVRIPYPYEEWNQIYSLPYGKDLYDIDISPDGRILTGALAEISGRQTLICAETADLLDGDHTLASIFDFGVSLPANFVFSQDGRYLYGASYYSGVSNVFRYDFMRDSMEAVTNAETGFFRPVPLENDSLVVFRFTAKGFQPAMIRDTVIEDISAIRFLGQEVVKKRPIVKKWLVSPPSSVNIDSAITKKAAYNGLMHLRVESAYPIVEGYKDYAALGARVEIGEPVGFHSSDLTVSYSPDTELPDNERFHVNWNYDYLQWNLNFQYNGADFYDLFGPTKTSRKGYSVAVQRRHMLRYDLPKTMEYRVSAAGYWDLERLPDFQNVATSFDKFATLSAALDYRNLRASLGAIDYEKGYKWHLSGFGTWVRKDIYPRVSATLDVGVPLPLKHSSFWLRTAAGYSPGDRLDPFANFFFGGFGNNWVDYQSIQRFRTSSAFPGVELDAIGGTNYGRVMGEWILPPLRFRRLGTSWFYLTWARMSIFSSAIGTNLDERAYRSKLANIGSQVDLRLTLLSFYRMTFSVGYATAFEEGWRPASEWMVSLKIL